jgi:ribosome-associated protein
VKRKTKLGTIKVRTSDSRQAAFIAANAAEDKKSLGTLVLDVGQVTVLADFFVIAGGETLTQVRAIVDNIENALSQVGLKPRTIEGKKEGRWVLMDYELIIVHVLHERERNFYKLEQFWNHALIVDPSEWLEEEPELPQSETRPIRRTTRKKSE